MTSLQLAKLRALVQARDWRAAGVALLQLATNPASYPKYARGWLRTRLSSGAAARSDGTAGDLAALAKPKVRSR